MALKRAARPRPAEDEEVGSEQVAAFRRGSAEGTAADNGEDEDALPVSNPLRGGWSAGKQTMDATSSFAQAFKPEANMQIVKFLDDTPYVNYRRHWIDRTGPQGAYKRPYVCPQTVGKECPLCKAGDKVQGVSSFNVALIGDDGVCTLRTWDVGVKLFNVLSNYHSDPKIGPLTKGYFGVSQSGGGQGAKRGGQTQTNVIPIKPTSLKEDYGIDPPTVKELEAVGKYDMSVIEIPKKKELDEVAAELLADFD
jgi:hypothetical protein